MTPESDSDALPFCPSCNLDLDLSQPDQDRPTRLLGVCEQCGEWYRFDGETGALARLAVE